MDGSTLPDISDEMSIRDGTRAVVNDSEVLPVGTMLGSVDGSLGAEDGG